MQTFTLTFLSSDIESPNAPSSWRSMLGMTALDKCLKFEITSSSRLSCKRRIKSMSNYLIKSTWHTESVRSRSSSGFKPICSAVDTSGLFPWMMGDSSDARSTSPSRMAYKASKNALVILVTKPEGIGCCFRGRVAEEEDTSTPPAILKAAVVICRWKTSIWRR